MHEPFGLKFSPFSVMWWYSQQQQQQGHNWLILCLELPITGSPCNNKWWKEYQIIFSSSFSNRLEDFCEPTTTTGRHKWRAEMFARVIHQFQMSTTGAADSSQDNTREAYRRQRESAPWAASKSRKRKNKKCCYRSNMWRPALFFPPWTMDSRHFIFWTIQNALV